MTGPRAAAEHYILGDDCYILRPATPISDGGGGFTVGSPTTIGPIACAFSEVSGDEATDAVIAVRGRYRLDVAVSTDIRATDQVEVLGDIYDVTWTPPAGALALLRTIGLKDSIGTA